jgi:signal transduction histidine kinase
VDIQAEVQSQLHKIHRTRNRIGYVPNPLTLLVSIYFQRELLLHDSRWWWAIILVFLGTFIRVLVGEVLFDQWEKGKKWARALSILGFVSLAVGWGLHFADIHYHYGASSSNLSYTLLIIAAYMTGASTSLLADKASYYTFVYGLAFMVIGTFCTDLDSQYAFIMLNVIVYLFFSVTNFKISHKQLCDLLESQIKSENEKNRLQKIINTVPGFVGLVDKDLVCYLANQNTLNLYPDIIGKKIGNFDATSNWERDVINFVNSDKASEIFEEQTTLSGQMIYAILNVQRLEDGGVIIVSIITTELVEAQKIIREQEAKSHYSAKLASLGEMAAGIAHEVNNPLSIIQGSANIVRRLVDQTPIDIVNVKLLTTKMIETSDRISKTIKSLKALSRNAESDPMLKVSLNNVIHLSADVIEQRFRQHGVLLKWLPLPEDIHVMAREAELMQVFTNLLGNSIDAIKTLDERWVEIQAEKKGEFVDIYFTDSGKGISPEIQKKIMEPFFTTKDVNQGTGLGLSISKNIIKNHDGELSLVPESPHTMFKIRLPICHE